MSIARAVPENVRQGAVTPLNSLHAWRETWMQSVNDPDAFWLQEAREQIRWMRAPTRGCQGDFYSVQDAPIRWFADGVLNITESCLDRHVETQPDAIALLWEADDERDRRAITYQELLDDVCRLANGLRSLGVKKGDRVVAYMGIVPESVVVMLACARIGAVHSLIFGGFSSDAIESRIHDSGARVVITQDQGRRGGKPIPLKETMDVALQDAPEVAHVIVFERTHAQVLWTAERDISWHALLQDQPTVCAPEPMAAEDPLFLMYTSGSTGKPKGLIHTCGGYATYVGYTHRTVFDARPGDVHMCTADTAGITGHSYTVYGPLLNGVTTVIFEPTPTYPDAGRLWRAVETHRVNVLYTAPTALRTLAAADDRFVLDYDRSSLRILGSVGEPINAEAWNWYYDVVGNGQCTIVDTWWQTETGGICISPIGPATPVKPGCATLPLPTIQPAIVDEQGHAQFGPAEGALCIRAPWPAMARTIHGDHARYYQTYFAPYPGYYFSGDGCRRDSDGYHWVTGRIDDVINVSGHRMGTAEFESALLEVKELTESAVVGYPHATKGQGVCAFLVARPHISISSAFEEKIQRHIRAHIGAHARIDRFEFVSDLPKTRSGKIMRRILRNIAAGKSDFGDVSTLADADVVIHLQAHVQNTGRS